MTPRVNAHIPLSLLEAVRRSEMPEINDEETEYVHELRDKRLGPNDTVYKEIQRYSDAVKRGQGIWYGEATGLATLIGRRPDAEDLYDSAGKILANEVYQAISPARRSTIRKLPALIGRPLALRELRQIAIRYFRGRLVRSGGSLILSVPYSVTANSMQGSLGCTYYASALRELLRLLIHSGGSVDHFRCLQRGDTSCEWRVEWRSLQPETS